MTSTNSHQPTAACSQSNRLHVFLGTLLLLQCMVGAVGDHSHPWPVQQLEPSRLPGHAMCWSSSRHCMDAGHCESSEKDVLYASLWQKL